VFLRDDYLYMLSSELKYLTLNVLNFYFQLLL